MPASADGMTGGAGDPGLTDGPTARHDDVTCLGCGCACDDITVLAHGARIAEVRQACSLGLAWFGDGTVPGRAISAGRAVTAAEAVADAARLLADAARGTLVYLAPELSCEAQRQGAAIADLLGAALDNVSTDTVLDGLLATQRRGRASCTLGEVRNRADLVVYWGVDPAVRYPRFEERYAPRHAGRDTIAVDVGRSRGPAGAASRVAVEPAREADALSLMTAAVKRGDDGGNGDAAWARGALALAARLAAARYAVIVHDAEPPDEGGDDDGDDRRAARAEGLIVLTQALNARTRAALSTLRAGGNRGGAEAVMAWQTGFPLAVDFAPGHPRYRPHDGALALLERGEVDAALVIGAARLLPERVRAALARVRCAVVGPRASESSFGAEVAVDTGIAGIHEGGLALRMDDVPLPLRPVLRGTVPTAAAVARGIFGALRVAGRGARAAGAAATPTPAAAPGLRDPAP